MKNLYGGPRKMKQLGTVVKIGKKRFVLNEVKVGYISMPSGDQVEHRVYCYTPIPVGMTAKDLGRRFEGSFLTQEFVTTPLGGSDE